LKTVRHSHSELSTIFSNRAIMLVLRTQNDLSNQETASTLQVLDRLPENPVVGRWIGRSLGGAIAFAAITFVAPQAQAFLLTSSFGSNQVLSYDETTGTFLGTFGQANNLDSGLSGPDGLTFGLDGNLYVSSFLSSEILKYDGVTGEFLGIFGDASNTNSGLVNPVGSTFGLDGNLYVSSFGTNEVLKYDGMTGAFLGIFGDASDAGSGLGNPDNLTFGLDGNLYVSSFATDEILKYDGMTGAFLGIFGDAFNAASGLDNPTGLTFGPDGNLYVTSYFSDEVLRYDGTTGAFLGVFGDASSTNSSLNGPFNLTFGADGFLYVSSSNFLSPNEDPVDRVLRYDSVTGAFAGVVLDPSNTNGQLSVPAGLVFTPESVPEPSVVLGLLGLGAWGVSSRRLHRQGRSS